jgi:hypothetical protein
LVATRSGGDDFVRIGCPDEGLWLLVMIDDEAVDGGLENPALERGLVRMAKPSTALSQLAEVGVKWNIQRGCRPSHSITLGCFWVV